MFGHESVLNELAHELDMDPMDLRLKNGSKPGDERPMGGRWGQVGNVEVMEAMRDHPHYKSELQGSKSGSRRSDGVLG